MTPLNSQSSIQVTLVGLIATFVDPKNEICTVGVLRDTPGGHTLQITVNKADANGDFQPFAEIIDADVKDQLEVKVKNTSKQGIARREKPIDRKSGPTVENRDSFLWVVDFESDLYSEPIGAKKEGFRPLLTLNNGELLARNLSANELIIKRGKDGPPEVFGVVATKTGIDIVLDQPDSTAIFTNGGEVVFEADNQSSFQIIINRGCDSQPGGSDADSYYSALGDLVPNSERIFFSSTPLPRGTVSGPTTPDAACFGGNVSKSRLG